MSWTPERVKELKKMWLKGLSSGEIGRILGVSKNAIVGKVHRLNLEGRPSPIITGKKKEEAPAKKAAPVKKEVKIIKDVPVKAAKKPAKAENEEAFHQQNVKAFANATKAAKEAKAKKVAEGTTLVDLKPNSCRWPEGDPKESDFYFCGKEVVPGKIYCDEHCHVAYSNLLKSK